jgi:hypothetical protein
MSWSFYLRQLLFPNTNVAQHGSGDEIRNSAIPSNLIYLTP